MASIFPTAVSWAEHQVGITGRITAWFFVGASLGGMFMPWLIGQLFEPVGPWIAITIILVDLMAALAVFGLLALYSLRGSSGQVAEAQT
jgi:fucose permease